MKFKHGILTIGVTGGIGSGKTTVCKIFEELGAKVIYADELAKNLMTNDENLKRKIIKIFGNEAYIGGKLNRKFIADVIFTDEKKKKELESVVHPAVIKEILSEFKKLAKNKSVNFVIVEAALIFESGFDNELDYVIVVDADEETKIKRVMERDRCSREEVLKRMRSQMDVRKKRELADILLQNDGDIEELRNKVKFLYSLFDKISKSTEVN
ncbi:dephospho-CoA kinase [Candidatus Chrysopegis kryptomonas]|uniref:Dephospho-CoA kinase n=1 Tax=Candidatus Chryseopegocella kryptomonas TaxID=1633643 RepID=A0A0P1N0C8_9BACT|nr:dephospho-CoA kinase [Candidatus Chrysopegis kryptomonas]CUT01834.1 dephospho-CoA kinase [Candidatus Chrysopegis kryptomonas]